MTLADNMRQEAAEQRKAAGDLVQESKLIKRDGDGNLDAKNLLMAIVGFVNATTLETIADQTDFLRVSESQDESARQRKAVRDENHEIRVAAAAGDWTEFDRLVEARTSEIVELASQPDTELAP